MNPRRIALLLALALAALVSTKAAARIDVTLDADSLNGLLSTMASNQVEVGLAAGRKVTIHMEDLKVTGFDPTAGPNGGIATSLRMVVPELGIDIPVTPHLTLEINEGAGGVRSSFLRFDKVVLNLPLTGAVDVAALLPPVALLPDAGWVVNSARGRMRVKPTLVDAKTGTKNIRLGFTLEVTPTN
jgi:hypothetical protein